MKEPNKKDDKLKTSITKITEQIFMPGRQKDEVG